ncbi:Phospholipase C [Pseudogymnoascus destructans]|uniref:Phospholipase C n=1 Tax=Pseudogymnoascus destructans TaxID=655981 RepID=A0A177A447_9PEZI|nr:Phospholipase C [Pseudogymnoascus destructans]OAF56031.1 Phospholipase C [Pseudogymnoascus destructans]
MASVFIDLLEDYQVASKVGYMMTDNADNNDTMMEHLSAALQEQHNLTYDPLHYRLRCNGHIINLAAQSFLFNTETETLKRLLAHVSITCVISYTTSLTKNVSQF